ncbi:MAG: hypothetical protein JJU23_10820 [Cyclobacteriaceae bacterium]|nr:hypothetical protein [Cyclobacteriaceae bacterium]
MFNAAHGGGNHTREMYEAFQDHTKVEVFKHSSTKGFADTRIHNPKRSFSIRNLFAIPYFFYRSLKGIFSLCQLLKQKNIHMLYFRHDVDFLQLYYIRLIFPKLHIALEVNASSTEAFEDAFLANFLKRIELFVFSRVNVVYFITNSLKQYLNYHGSNSQILPNGFNRKLLSIVRKRDLQKTIESNQTITLGFLGVVNNFIYRYEFIKELSDHLDKKRISHRIILFGQAHVLEPKSNIEIFPYLSKWKAIELFCNEVDIAINLPVRDYTQPQKVFEYAALKIPIVLHFNKGLKEVFNEEEFFPCNSTAESYASKIEEIKKGKYNFINSKKTDCKLFGHTWHSNRDIVLSDFFKLNLAKN